ncbi:MAG: LPS assembly protein LptD [Firmicutes bacterium]|nr:LPS assembly protein LptD [Bacillota bacterium]
MHLNGRIPTIFSVSLLTLSPVAAAQEAPAGLAAQCIAPPDWYSSDYSAADIAPALSLAVPALSIQADHAEVLWQQQTSYSGNVTLNYQQQSLRTERAIYDQQTGRFEASGGIVYQDPQVAARGESVITDTVADTAELSQLDYYLRGTAARGSADRLFIAANDDSARQLSFQQASFTTCPGNTPVWEIRARQIQMNEDEGWGSARGAQIRLFDVPVVYIPRFSFPVTDERKSGLLYPTVRSSGRNGIEIEVPYYFNLAPNYDATIAPRLMTERGVMGVGEVRYMDTEQAGQVNLEYLHNDSSRQVNSARYFWRLEHEAQLNQNWSTYIDASQVSDVNYINDFGSAFVNRADSHLYRRGQANYVNARWQAQVQVEDFQLLGPYQNPFRTIPRLNTQYATETPRRQGWVFDWDSELTRFERQDGSPEQATRIHGEPGITYMMRRPGWEWSAESRLLMTHYEQELVEGDLLTRRSITRTLPEFRLHGQLNLERPFEFAGTQGIQTLQPQAQFLYTPYRDQRDIGVFDSVPLQDDYNGLFRKRRFSGLDRIADAHQVTLGATSSLFNQSAEELLRLSLGQIFYFSDSQTQLFDDSTQVEDNTSELAAELDFRISSRWFFNSSVQYDNQLNTMQKSRSALEYRKDENNLIQLNFRQLRGLTGTETDVEQVGALGAWQVSPQWSVAGHWYRDLRNSATLDANFGVQYESCCWAVRVSAYRRIDRNFEGIQAGLPLSPAEFDTGISLQFVITGLSADRSGLAGMLQQGIFGYRRPFYLSH